MANSIFEKSFGEMMQEALIYTTISCYLGENSLRYRRPRNSIYKETS
jgi:hypothetical protein